MASSAEQVSGLIREAGALSWDMEASEAAIERYRDMLESVMPDTGTWVAWLRCVIEDSLVSLEGEDEDDNEGCFAEVLEEK